jgi:quercetin dioxygenase-like cupin family protein
MSSVSASVIEPGGGEVIGDAPDRRVEILCEHDAVHATWTRFGPHRDGADLHIHRRHSDFFYVLEGELTARLGHDGEEVAVPAGRLVRVPPLVVHGFRNAAGRELRYLNFHAPGMGFADYMRGLRDKQPVAFDQEDPPPDGTRPATDAGISDGKVVVDQPGVQVVQLTDVPEVSIAEIRIDAGWRWAGLDRPCQALYVLDGTLTLTAGDEQMTAGAGSWVQIPPGEIGAESREPLRLLHIAAGT